MGAPIGGHRRQLCALISGVPTEVVTAQKLMGWTPPDGIDVP
jgi:hypothetical protein